jgi:enterochelin esterase-like enzyme
MEIGVERIGTYALRIEPAVGGPPRRALIVLDDEIYRDRVGAPGILARLQTDGRIPPTLVAFLRAGSAEARHRDFACNEAFARFLATDLRARVLRDQDPGLPVQLLGLSLSGLAALHAVLRHPGAFCGAVSQSPSAWWNDEWLARTVPAFPAGDARLWISVGSDETSFDVAHPPTGMHQRVCQLDSCRRLAAALQADRGLDVRFEIFQGGHDAEPWAAELPAALAWLNDPD